MPKRTEWIIENKQSLDTILKEKRRMKATTRITFARILYFQKVEKSTKI